MTAAQQLRAERRKILARARAERRAEVAKAILIGVAILLAFGLAGTMDYQDRTEGLGASMLPTAATTQAFED